MLQKAERSTFLEMELSEEITAIEQRARTIAISSVEEFEQASVFARELKQTEAKIKAYWKPKKDAAHKAHSVLCQSEKEMLDPVSKALSVLKQTMGEYTRKMEEEAERIAAEARRIAQEEAERKLAQAVEAEEQGNEAAATEAMQEAQIADTMSRFVTVDTAPPKVAGVSQSQDWEIVNINSSAVPISFNGMELRPVDDKAVMRLIRASKGKINIPGVTYKQIVKTSIRR